MENAELSVSLDPSLNLVYFLVVYISMKTSGRSVGSEL